MLSNKNFPEGEIVIFVDGATRKANRIAQHLVKFVINVVERTTLRMYANLINLDPAESVDQTEIGHVGPRVNVPTDVIFMKLIAVMTALRIVLMRVQMWMIRQIRSRVYFIIEMFGGPGDK